MTAAELKDKLRELGLPDDYFSFNEKESWGINMTFYDYNRKWRVYSHERDNYLYDETFADEQAAFAYVYEQGKKDAKYYNRTTDSGRDEVTSI